MSNSQPKTKVFVLMRNVPYEFDECWGVYTTYARASSAKVRAIRSKKATLGNLSIETLILNQDSFK